MLKAAPMQAAVTVIKTWANSWTTSARYHDDKLGHCCFGCVHEVDSLEHYLVCGPLWRVTASATKIGYAEDVLGRLCIVTPCRDDLLNLVVASGTYHTVKMQYLDKVREAKTLNEWQDLYDLARAIATNLAREWSNLGSAGGKTARSDSASAGVATPPAQSTIAQSSADSGLLVPKSLVFSRTPATTSTDAQSSTTKENQPFIDERAHCEPECNDLGSGLHHPNCSQALLLLEAAAFADSDASGINPR
jgi:hypothetical protein